MPYPCDDSANPRAPACRRRHRVPSPSTPLPRRPHTPADAGPRPAAAVDRRLPPRRGDVRAGPTPLPMPDPARPVIRQHHGQSPRPPCTVARPARRLAPLPRAAASRNAVADPALLRWILAPAPALWNAAAQPNRGTPLPDPARAAADAARSGSACLAHRRCQPSSPLRPPRNASTTGRRPPLSTSTSPQSRARGKQVSKQSAAEIFYCSNS
ncbi:hypothetical protein BS78_04G124800 [Paspalum vaginatum]|nr:hypothetical protein BS78_04G124800 [Paspalum vaginatum]